MRVGVIGSGQVGQVLANGFLQHGHTVMCASRDPSKLEGWLAEAGERASVGTFAEGAEWAELVVQSLAPEPRFVKSFSCVGNALMVNPDLPGGKPTMFMCGNDEAAEDEVKGILDAFGWEHEDLGGAAAARAIEPLAILWCIPGFLRNDWVRAYKVLRP